MWGRDKIGDEACMLCFYHGRRKEDEEKEGGGSYAGQAGICDDDGATTAVAVVSSTSLAVVRLVWVSAIWVNSQNAPSCQSNAGSVR